MASNRFHPLPLKKLYELSVSLGPSPSLDEISNKLGLRSKRTAQQYEKTLKWLSERVKALGSIEEYSEELVKVLSVELKLEEALKKLAREMIPLTPSSLQSVLTSDGLRVTITEAKAMISWLKQAGALKERKVPVLTPTLKDKVLEDVRSRGSLTYSTLRKAYGDGVRDIIVSLWKEGLISVPALEKYKEVLAHVEDLDRLPGDVKGGIFTTWQDRITGETYAELVIPARARIEARWSL